jgi:hypothetical protein
VAEFTAYFGPDNEYEVSVNTDMDGHGDDSPDKVTGCWIEHKPTGATASLAALEATGLLVRERSWSYLERPVPLHLIDEISEWAEDVGY